VVIYTHTALQQKAKIYQNNDQSNWHSNRESKIMICTSTRKNATSAMDYAHFADYHVELAAHGREYSPPGNSVFEGCKHLLT